MDRIELEKTLATDSRFSDFKLLEEPVSFSEKFKDENFDRVQVYLDAFPRGIIFCGVLKWQDNKIISMDGDSYNPKMLVYAHFTYTLNNEKGLDVIVDSF